MASTRHHYSISWEGLFQPYLIILLDGMDYVLGEMRGLNEPETSPTAPQGRIPMSRLTIPARDDAPEASNAVLDAVHKQPGAVPNMFRLIASSCAALQGFVTNNSALTKTLDVRTREQITLAVAQLNGCDYCLPARSYPGLNLAKITPEEIALNRKCESGDAKADAAERFATKVVRERGHIGHADIKTVHDAGFNDSRIVEIIAVVAENIFANLLNVVAETDIDFRSFALATRAKFRNLGETGDDSR